MLDRVDRILRKNLADARKFSGGRMAALYERGKKWAYLDSNGNWAMPARFTRAGDFSEGLVAAANESGYGSIDTAGNWVIPPQYKQAGPFSEGLAHVMGENPPAMFIDRTGKVVIPKAGSKVTRWPFRNGFACLENSFMNTRYFIDTLGKALPHPELEECTDFGLIDTAGRLVLPPIYTSLIHGGGLVVFLPGTGVSLLSTERPRTPSPGPAPTRAEPAARAPPGTWRGR